MSQGPISAFVRVNKGNMDPRSLKKIADDGEICLKDLSEPISANLRTFSTRLFSPNKHILRAMTPKVVLITYVTKELKL